MHEPHQKPLIRPPEDSTVIDEPELELTTGDDEDDEDDEDEPDTGR